MVIRFFSASRDSTFLFAENPTFEAHINVQKKDYGNEVYTNFLPNNTAPITEVYNSVLAQLRSEALSGKTDFAVLLHGDVAFDLGEFMRRLTEVKDKYDLIGFAGTKKAKLSQRPFTWFTGSIPYENARYGRVAMQNPKSESFFNQHDPNVMDTDVALIDGLCMILSKRIIESDIKFDTQFKFDFYDSDFCLECLKRGFRIGTIVMPVFHKSAGDRVMTEEYLVPNRAFAKKWGFYDKAFGDLDAAMGRIEELSKKKTEGTMVPELDKLASQAGAVASMLGTAQPAS